MLYESLRMNYYFVISILLPVAESNQKMTASSLHMTIEHLMYCTCLKAFAVVRDQYLISVL